ncbi:MAG: peroxiredoxin [Sphingomonadaceae bacterium]|nr:peroxiredoxin [Sphingomonadaceae bacterium]
MADLEVGDEAPDFTLTADDGRTLRLADFAGRKLVLYFYPKDDTSGCTREAIDFSGLLPRFEAAGAAIVGVSKDGAVSKAKFRAKHDLTVGLAADESGVTEAYGAWVQKSMYGRTYMGIDRSTFLIGRDGRIAATWRKVKVPGHAEAVLKAVEALG